MDMAFTGLKHVNPVSTKKHFTAASPKFFGKLMLRGTLSALGLAACQKEPSDQIKPNITVNKSIYTTVQGEKPVYQDGGFAFNSFMFDGGIDSKVGYGSMRNKSLSSGDTINFGGLSIKYGGAHMTYHQFFVNRIDSLVAFLATNPDAPSLSGVGVMFFKLNGGNLQLTSDTATKLVGKEIKAGPDTTFVISYFEKYIYYFPVLPAGTDTLAIWVDKWTHGSPNVADVEILKK